MADELDTSAPSEVELPWRVNGLDGYNSEQGPTYDGGWFAGGGARRDRSVTVRVVTPMGRPASVELDLCDDWHGCSASLSPEVARQAAYALIAGAEKAEAEMAHWRGVLDRQRAEVAALRLADIAGRAGEQAEERERSQ